MSSPPRIREIIAGFTNNRRACQRRGGFALGKTAMIFKGFPRFREFDREGHFLDDKVRTGCFQRFSQSLQVDGEGYPTYAYDAWNRLVVASLDAGDAYYSVDALGRRIKESPAGDVTRDLYYSDPWQVLEERIGGDPTAQYVWSPAYVDAMVLRDRDTNDDGFLDERLFALHDANYNVTALIDASAAVVERFVYDPYGAVTVLDGNWAADADGQSDVGWVYLHQGGRIDRESTTRTWGAGCNRTRRGMWMG